ncbi:MAG TPA: DUF1572 family protein [Candidatus Acidoferrales bacterium]|nr:DUF1572 family protein [Candidatus Acidoferrales bacterium]
MQENDFLKETIQQFRALKKLADGAMAQVSNEHFFAQLDNESNSIAMVLKHVGGNLRSRWTDLLTSDGEKPDRNRDGEFLQTPKDTKENLLSYWEEGWRRAFESLERLTPADLGRTVLIRSEPHTVIRATQRSLSHTAQHVGQIVLLAKHYTGSQWRTLSIPRGKSQEFRDQMLEKHRKS